MIRNANRLVLAALLTLAFPAHSQDKEWVTINLGTDGRQAGAAGIGDDGTIAWVEVNAGMLDVFRRRTDGTKELVTSHIVTLEQWGWPVRLRVQDDGTVFSCAENPSSNRWDCFVDDVLAHTDSRIRGATTGGGVLSFAATWSGNGYGHLSVFDSSTSTRTVDDFDDRFVNIRPLAASGAGALFLQADGVDPADTGLYTWENGTLTPEPPAGQPENFTIDYSVSSGDFSGDFLAYSYGGAIDGWPEDVFAVVVKDLGTAQTSSFWLTYSLPRAYYGVGVDGSGRAYYIENIEYSNSLFVFEDGEQRFVTELLCGPWTFNASGHLAYARYTGDECLDEPNRPESDTTDIVILDLADNSEVQVTFNEPQQYIQNLSINESDDVAFSYSENVVFPDNTHPLRFAAAAVIDTEPPTTPSNLSATSSSQTSVDITWNPSTDAVEFGGYDVFRDDALIATVSAPSHTDSGLAPGTAYTYYIEAFDLADNRSRSSSVTVTTAAPVVVRPSGGGGIGIVFLLLLATFFVLRPARKRGSDAFSPDF